MHTEYQMKETETQQEEVKKSRIKSEMMCRAFFSVLLFTLHVQYM